MKECQKNIMFYLYLNNVLLVFELGENGGKFVFSNAEEIYEWANKEIDFWRWIESDQNIIVPRLIDGNSYQSIKNRFVFPSHIAGRARELSAALKDGREHQSKQIKDQIMLAFDQYRNSNIPHSSTVDASIIQNLYTAHGAASAFFRVMICIGCDHNPGKQNCA